MSSPSESPREPSLPWRIGSALTIGTVGSLCRTFLYALNETETVGLDRFLKILDERRDLDGRTRGLLTGMRYPSIAVFSCRSLISYM
jgi:monolysocardiolipin acyltransferase